MHGATIKVSTVSFNIQELYTLSTVCIYVLCVWTSEKKNKTGNILIT
jgi:hypothetical protein